MPELRKSLRGKGIGVRPDVSWLTGYRRLNHRYERQPRNHPAFLDLAAAICCYQRAPSHHEMGHGPRDPDKGLGRGG
ncbi:hypothetical protein SUDANB120_06120 [Streptomyces sp. enrichment culture]